MPVVENTASPVDCLIVATKAAGLDDALDRVAADAPTLVVPLLNGVEHLATLRARFGSERVVAAVIRIESDRPRPGVIVQSSPGARIDIAGPPPTGTEPVVQALAAELRAAGLDVRLGAPEPDVMWSKLARLCPLALTTTASDRPIGFVRTDPRWRSALTNAVTETVAVAVAEGAQLDAADTIAELDARPSGARFLDAARCPRRPRARTRPDRRRGRCARARVTGCAARRFSGSPTGSRCATPEGNQDGAAGWEVSPVYASWGGGVGGEPDPDQWGREVGP